MPNNPESTSNVHSNVSVNKAGVLFVFVNVHVTVLPAGTVKLVLLSVFTPSEQETEVRVKFAFADSVTL